MRNVQYIECVGIADSEGLDSFHPCSPDVNRIIHYLVLRARFNEHRRPLVFKALLTKEDVEIIRSVSDNRKALEYLKANALSVSVIGHHKEEHWDSLPYYPSTRKYPVKIEAEESEQLDLNFNQLKGLCNENKEKEGSQQEEDQ